MADLENAEGRGAGGAPSSPARDHVPEGELRTQRALATFEREVLALLAENAPLDRVLDAMAVGLEHLASPGMLASILLIE